MSGTQLTPSDRAPGLLVGEGVEIPEDVLIGGHVIIHSNVSLGPGCTVLDRAVLGARIGRTARDARPNHPLRVGRDTSIGTGAFLVEGSEIGERVLVGDDAFVLKGVQVGDGGLLGTRTTIGENSVLGARLRIQHQSFIAPPAVVEEDVFIGPNVTTTNDSTLHRMGADDQMRGPVLRRGCRIGAAALLFPGIEVGEQALVAAGSLVTRDVPPRAVVMGQPAKVIREVPEQDLLPTETARPNGAE